MTSSNERYADSMIDSQQGLKFLSRPEDPRAFRLTERDVSLLQVPARFGEVTTEQVSRFAGCSVRAARERLKLLYWHKYLARPHTQRAFRAAVPGASLIVSLTRKGAQELEKRGMALAHLIDRSYRPPSPFLLPHTLAVTDFMLDLYDDARARGVAIADHADLIPVFPEATRASRNPFHLDVTVTERGKPLRIAVRPDRVCAVELPNATRLPLVVELDRGTETIGKKIAHKHKTYRQALLQGRHNELWGFSRFRCLIHTTSLRRVAAMLDAQHHLTTQGHAADLFLYSTPALTAAHGPLGPAWLAASLSPVKDELAYQAALRDGSGRLTTKPRTRIDRLTAILENSERIALIPAATI